MVKRFLSFSVCGGNITLEAAWFGQVAYRAVGYQLVTVSHFSPSQGLSTNMSVYTRLPLAQRCITGFTVPAPKDTGDKLKQSLNSKPILSAVPHSPGEEHPVKHPAAGVKSPSVGGEEITAGHGVGL